ncbi:hypothetical protein VTN77DRAFT_1378 [Rasamsonia byssochlamydoides]|uniref:uncharacterized protein n=1 Tax=Rasamsonia byssochlamydoides TaxID=89139 RepID=UPI0037439E86
MLGGGGGGGVCQSLKISESRLIVDLFPLFLFLFLSRLLSLSACSAVQLSTMRTLCLLVAWAWTAWAAPAPTSTDQSTTTTTTTASSKTSLASQSTDDGESQTGVIVASVLFSLVIVATIVGLTVVYLRDLHNFFKRRQQKRMSQSSTMPLAEDFAKRPSFVSDRESLMFSKSPSSSLQFPVAEPTSPQPVQPVFFRRGDTYVPLEQVDTSYNAGDSAIMHEEHRYDPDSHVSYDDSKTTSVIPVIITPPSEAASPQVTDACPAEFANTTTDVQRLPPSQKAASGNLSPGHHTKQQERQR